MTVTVKERPIIMQAESVRAILEGRKTQTRRAVGDVSSDVTAWEYHGDRRWVPLFALNGELQEKCWTHTCPYGEKGTRLWVREAWTVVGIGKPTSIDRDRVFYGADGNGHNARMLRMTPSIFMPRWASRITLEITGVRVHRLKEISGNDAREEGIAYLTNDEKSVRSSNERVDQFHKLWDSINAHRGYGWDANPWVWVIEFKRLEPK